MTEEVCPLPADFDTWDEYDRDVFMVRKRWLDKARPTYTDEHGLIHAQLPPSGVRDIWLLLSGRGFGKTRVAAEDFGYWAMAIPKQKYLVGAPTFDAIRDVCFEGESGICNVIPEKYYKWNRSMGEMFLSNGTLIKGISGENPSRLRGRQFHRAWVDELAAFEYPDDYWMQVELTVRLPTELRPTMIVTTTPQPIELMFKLRDRSRNEPPRKLVDAAPDVMSLPKAQQLPGHGNPFMDAAVVF